MGEEYAKYAELRLGRWISGRGAMRFLPTLGKKRIAVIYDGGVLTEAAREKLRQPLAAAGAEVRFIADIRHEPGFQDIRAALAALGDFQPDLFAAVGGGSVLDIAKAVWLFYENPGLPFADSFKPFQLPGGSGKSEIAAIPTTSGTGSETTCCAVFTDEETRQKRLILGYNIVPAYAILDPDFTDTLPDSIAAHTGMDALAHAIEAAVCKASSPIVVSLALGAACDLLENLPVSVNAPPGSREKRAARDLCHYAAAIAGAAINNSSAGLVHALDQPGPYFNLPHGLVCGLLLPYATAAHSPHPLYATLARRLGRQGDETDLCVQLADCLWDLNAAVGIPRSFQALGIDEAEFFRQLPNFAGAVENSMAANLAPREVTPASAAAILRAAYYGQKPTVPPTLANT
ncbi:MAG: iron-containing alcohol dehydrogenase [Peptococcaceae bacterium]|jgi:alcohol dehydrogenase class IV|nr:iron-containing alcohol dehydrogenase [Peptococcaceae bacterium]